MFTGALSITHLTRKDWEKFQKFFLYVYHMKGEVWQGGSPIIKHNLSRPNYSLENDLFIAEWKARMVGIADVTFELRLARAIVDWFVHPAFHRKKVGRALLRYASARGRDLGAKVAHMCIQEEDEFSKNFSVEIGFFQIRCFLEMEIDLIQASPESPGKVKTEHFRPGDEALLATTQNRVFSGSWGFCPNSPEDIRYYLRVTDSRWHDILLIREEEKIVGYFWPYTVMEEKRTGAKQKWRIHMFGIEPGFQGKGWGKKLLWAGLEYLKKKGARAAELTVDQENIPALGLYKSLGFKTKRRDFWYEKSLL
jgi:mycothiol synthase